MLKEFDLPVRIVGIAHRPLATPAREVFTAAGTVSPLEGPFGTAWLVGADPSQSQLERLNALGLDVCTRACAGARSGSMMTSALLTFTLCAALALVALTIASRMTLGRRQTGAARTLDGLGMPIGSQRLAGAVEALVAGTAGSLLVLALTAPAAAGRIATQSGRELDGAVVAWGPVLGIAALMTAVAVITGALQPSLGREDRARPPARIAERWPAPTRTNGLRSPLRYPRRSVAVLLVAAVTAGVAVGLSVFWRGVDASMEAVDTPTRRVGEIEVVLRGTQPPRAWSPGSAPSRAQQSPGSPRWPCPDGRAASRSLA